MALLLVLAYIFVGILIAIWSAKVDVDEHMSPIAIVGLWPVLMIGFVLFCLNDYILEIGKKLRK